MPNDDMGHFTSGNFAEQGRTSRRILLDRTLSPVVLAYTFAHEIAHMNDHYLNNAAMVSQYKRHSDNFEAVAYYASMWLTSYWGLMPWVPGGPDMFRAQVNKYHSYEKMMLNDLMIHRADRGIVSVLRYHRNGPSLIAAHRRMRAAEGRPDSGRTFIGKKLFKMNPRPVSSRI